MALKSTDSNPAEMAKMVAGMPDKRLAMAEEIAEACVFLCSESATYISGIALTIDHGLTAAMLS